MTSHEELFEFACNVREFFFNEFCGLFPKGGGSFDDADLFDVGKGDYKPEGGKMSAPVPFILLLQSSVTLIKCCNCQALTGKCTPNQYLL